MYNTILRCNIQLLWHRCLISNLFTTNPHGHPFMGDCETLNCLGEASWSDLTGSIAFKGHGSTLLSPLIYQYLGMILESDYYVLYRIYTVSICCIVLGYWFFSSELVVVFGIDQISKWLKRRQFLPHLDLNMPAYVLSHKAYLSLLLHAARHPHKPVNGVLLGKSSGADTVDVVATVPLLHAWTSLSPMMEIGLDLVGSIRTLGAASGKLSFCRQHLSLRTKA